MVEPSKQNKGNAGEYYFAYLLSINDCAVSVGRGNNVAFDLLVSTPSDKRVCISVKSKYSKNYFLLSAKDEYYQNLDFFWAFVDFAKDYNNPDFWVFPAIEVSKYLNQFTPKIPADHKPGDPMRDFYMVKNKWTPDNWDEKLEKYHKNIKQILEF